MKLTAKDIVRILQEYSEANTDAAPSEIKLLKTSHPEGSHSRIDFEYRRSKWRLLVDNTADNDEDYIRQQLEICDGDLLSLPGQVGQQLTYRGKDIYVIKKLPEGIRLDAYLVAEYPGQSRSYWQGRIKEGQVRVNNQVETLPSRQVKPADTVAADLPELPDFTNQSIPVIYQDEEIIVVDKPSGMLTHAKGANLDEFTVAEFFRSKVQWQLDTNRPGVVHRLDRGTSGVIVGAKTEEAGKYLQKQFAKRTVKKVYRAVVAGSPKQSEAVIDLPIERNPNRPSQFRVGAAGKPAVTRYKVLDTARGESLIELYPQTGRTHQLRVHLAYLGTPIKGDVTYGGKRADRMHLHACSLELTRPDRTRDIFKSDIPDNFWK